MLKHEEDRRIYERSARLILLLAAAAVVMMLSYRCGTVPTLLLSQLLLLVPTGAAYALV